MTPFRAFLYTMIFLGLCNSCSQLRHIVRPVPDYPNVHPFLERYVLKVRELSEGCLGNIKYAGFKEFEKDTILGQANWVLPYFEPQINISLDHWLKLKDIQRILLVAHELYHAEKPYIGHIGGKDEYGCAEHLMYPTQQVIGCDRFKFDQYVKQMKDCHGKK